MRLEISDAMRERIEAFERTQAEYDELLQHPQGRALRLRDAQSRRNHAALEIARLASAEAKAAKQQPDDPRLTAYWVNVLMGAGKLTCERCGATETLQLPCFVQDFRVHLAGFIKKHATCEPAAGPKYAGKK